MEITYAELIGSIRALETLSKRRVPVAGALAVRRLMRQVQGHLADYHAVRKGLLDRHAEHDERGHIRQGDAGQALFADEAAQQAFIAEQRALLAEKVMLDDWLTVDRLGTDPIEPEVLLALGSLLQEE